MAQLNYRPNRIAQSLGRQRTYTIGLVVPNIANPYLSDIALGSQHVAQQHNYSIFLCNTGWAPDEEHRVLDRLAEQRVDGIILPGSRCSDEVLREFSEMYRGQMIISGRDFSGPGICTITTNFDQGANLAVEYLKAKGHTAIGLLTGEKTAAKMSNTLRLAGFQRAFEACNLSLRDEWIMHGALTASGGYQSVKQLLDQSPELTALLAHNDLVAIGAIKACQELGRRVPEDIAVIGFNNIDLASMMTPALTTVYVDRYGDGQRVAARLIEMINEPSKTYPPLKLPVGQLIKRDSA